MNKFKVGDEVKQVESWPIGSWNFNSVGVVVEVGEVGEAGILVAANDLEDSVWYTDDMLELVHKQTTDDLIQAVEEWATERNLHTSDPTKQYLKVAEETGEIASALARGQDHELKDAIGDVTVTLIILAMQSGTDLQECLKLAYDEIKNRKGKTVNGVFVKEEE